MRTQSSNLEGNRCGFIISPEPNTKKKARGDWCSATDMSGRIYMDDKPPCFCSAKLSCTVCDVDQFGSAFPKSCLLKTAAHEHMCNYPLRHKQPVNT